MSFYPARPAKSVQSPGQARAAGLDLGNLGQLSGSEWLDHSLSPYAAYGVISSLAPYSAGCPADLATAYPLAQAAIQTALQFLDIGCTRTGHLFNNQEFLAPGQPPLGSLEQGAPAADSPWPSTTPSAAALQRPAQNRTALTLSAPISGSGNLILAARRSSPATSQRVQARTQTRPARQKPIYR